MATPRKIRDGTWGASAYDAPDVTTGKIREAIKAWANGFYRCLNPEGRSFTSFRIASGVTNQYPSAWGNTQARNHGEQWAKMIKNVNEYLQAQDRFGPIAARGAVDIELGYDGPVISRAWTNGYNDVSGRYAYYNFGDAAGCRTFDSGDADSCGTATFPGWDSSDLHYISWGNPAGLPLPQIYTENGTQAEQWIMISQWGVNNLEGRLIFSGPLTQQRACDQVGGCGGIDNSPNQAWNQVDNKMHAKPDTKHETQNSVDVKWQNP